MRVLQVHNFYQQRGGEDSVFQSEFELLCRHGHHVVRYTAHNDRIDDMPRWQSALVTIWNSDTRREIERILRSEQVDVVHVHNTFPLISPSLYYAAASAGVPVVQTLHNYRLVCPAATLFREGRVCEDCVGKPPYRAVVHACYRGSKTASAVVAGMLSAHRMAGTWERRVQIYIALTPFSRDLFIQGGLPGDRIVVKPNCLPQDPGQGYGTGNYALFAGRLSPEKGVRELLEAWRLLPQPFQLKIAGDGVMRDWVQQMSLRSPSVEFLGPLSPARLLELIKDASFLILPSSWYEGLPMTIVEAFAAGTPVIASHLPSMDDLVKDGVTGARFTAGNPADLARVVTSLSRDHAAGALRMREAARKMYLEQYTPDRNYELLKAIYERAIREFRTQWGKQETNSAEELPKWG